MADTDNKPVVAPVEAKKEVKPVENPLAKYDIEGFSIKIGDNEVPVIKHKISRGKAKDSEYFHVDTSSMDAEGLVKLFDPLTIGKWLKRQFQSFCSVASREAAEFAKGDTQKLQEKFQEFVSQLSAIGETNRVLILRRNELFAQFGDVDTTTPEGQLRAIALFKEMQEVQTALAEKKISKEQEDKDAESAEKGGKEAAAIAA